jgi:hypothetical protein
MPSRTSGGPVGFARAAARNGLKVLLPWELAHTAIWDLTLRNGSPVVDAELPVLPRKGEIDTDPAWGTQPVV